MLDTLKINLVDETQENKSTNEPIIETPKVSKPTKTQTQVSNDNISVNQLVEALGKVLVESNSKVSDRYRDEDLKREIQSQQSFYDNSNIGRSSQNFIDKMLDIVKNHKDQCDEIVWYDALAKKFGNVYNITVNGYTIMFIKGQKTIFPKCLAGEVNLRLNGFAKTTINSAVGVGVDKELQGQVEYDSVIKAR